MKDVHVTDRTYQDMLQGTEFERWPDPAPTARPLRHDEDDVPQVGERIVIFDCNLDFTQHDVLFRDEERRVLVGPAIPWD